MPQYEKEHEMPESVKNIYKKIDHIKEITKNLEKTHFEAYERGMSTFKDEKGNINYELLTDQTKRDELIEKCIEDKITVYREKAKEEYGLSKDNELISNEYHDNLDDFILNIYTGKTKEELSQGIRDHLKKDPENFKEDTYISITNSREGIPYHNIMNIKLMDSISYNIKDEESKEIVDYLSKSGLEKIADTNLLRKKDLINLLDLYDKGQRKLNKEIIKSKYGRIPAFLKDYTPEKVQEENEHYKKETSENKAASEDKQDQQTKDNREGDRERDEREIQQEQIEQIIDKLKKGEIKPSEAAENSVMNEGLNNLIEQMSKEGQLPEGFKEKYDNEKNKKEEEILSNIKKEIKELQNKGELSGKTLYDVSKQNQYIYPAINDLIKNNEISQETSKKISEEIEQARNEEKENLKQQIQNKELTPQDVLQRATQDRDQGNFLQELYNEQQLPKEFIDEYTSIMNEAMKEQQNQENTKEQSSQ